MSAPRLKGAWAWVPLIVGGLAWGWFGVYADLPALTCLVGGFGVGVVLSPAWFR